MPQKKAVNEAEYFVSSVIKTRAYPVSDFDQRASEAIPDVNESLR
jgi:hypothetical protein